MALTNNAGFNSDNFNLNDWDISLPVDSTGGSGGLATTITGLTGYESQYFYNNADGSMSFYAPVAGASISTSSGTRSELRETNSDGTLAGWTLSVGGTMSATLSIDSLPTLASGGQGKVIIGELQGTNCALVRLYDDGGKIYFKNQLLYQGQQDTYQLKDASGNTPTVALGQKFSYSIDAHGSALTVKVFIGGDVYTSTTVIDPSWQSQKLYFQAGVVNDDISAAGGALPQATGAGQATFYGLDMSHEAGGGMNGAQALVAQTDTFSGAQNTVITGNLLTNDTGPAGLTLSVAPATQTTAHGGTVTENADGTFIYTPAATFSGADSFTYTLKDSTGLTAIGIADITVNATASSGSSAPSASAPVAHADSVTGQVNQPITGNVLTNDTDPNGLALSVAPATMTTAHGGFVVENANGAFTYTPATGYVGSDTFNYTLNDSAGLSSTGTVNVATTPGAGYTLVFQPSFSTLSLESSSNPSGTWQTTFPYATPGSAGFSGRTLSSNNEGEFYSDPTVGVNPFSVNNGVLTITAAAATSQMLATEAAANGGKTLPYTSGLLTSYTSFAQTYGLYEVTAKMPGGQGMWPALWLLPASGAWPPEIDLLEEIGNQPTTDYMTLHTGTSNTALGTTSQVAMTTGFHTYAVDWEPATVTFYIDGKQVAQYATPSDMHQPMYMLMNLAVGGAGSWPGAPDGSTVFPSQMQISSVQVYASQNTIADYNHVGVQATPSPSPSPTPTPSPTPPVTQPESFMGTENHAVTGNVLTNVSDPNGLALSITAATTTTAHGGTVVQNVDGTFTYTPATNYVGTDTFTYTAMDTAGLSSTNTVTINVNPYSPPVAGADSFSGTSNHAITGNVLTNDTDPNGFSMTVDTGTFATAHGGTFVPHADGTFTYTPAANYTGTDSVYYTVRDTAGAASSGSASFTVNASTTAPPVATTDNFTGQVNVAVTGNLLTNDSDPNGLSLSVKAATITTAHGGTAVEHADGTFIYTPAANYAGNDSFSYTLDDSAGLTAIGMANLNIVAPVATASAHADNFAVTQNYMLFGNLLANNGGGADTGTGHLTTVSASIKTVQGGRVAEHSDGTFAYTPKAGFVGTDSFTYTLHDSAGHTTTGTAVISVVGKNASGTVIFGTGSETLYGASTTGDTFVFKSASFGTGTDAIGNFSVRGHDKIDISDVLSGHFDPVADNLDSFVKIIQSGRDSVLEVDVTGRAGASGWTAVTTISGVTGLDDHTLVHNGNLIV